MEERAAIKEFDGGLPREEAEQRALSAALWMLRERQKMNRQDQPVRELNRDEVRARGLPRNEPLYPHDEIAWFEGEENGAAESSPNENATAIRDESGSLAARK